MHYRTDKISYCRVELLEFAVKVLAPAAKAALDPETKPVAGEKQCEWCKARFTCTARAIDALQGAGELMGSADLARVLPVAKKFDSWLKDLESVAMDRLANGGSIAGYKLVEGQTRRRWRDDALEMIEQAGMADLLTERKLVTVTAAEKLLGKREAAPLMDAATERPAGSPVLVTEDDPRPGIAAGGQSFEDF